MVDALLKSFGTLGAGKEAKTKIAMAMMWHNCKPSCARLHMGIC